MQEQFPFLFCIPKLTLDAKFEYCKMGPWAKFSSKEHLAIYWYKFKDKSFWYLDILNLHQFCLMLFLFRFEKARWHKLLAQQDVTSMKFPNVNQKWKQILYLNSTILLYR